jgi:hypothetical protein
VITPIDPKYGVKIRDDGTPVIAKNSTGEEIPTDEPTIIFRARDRLAFTMLAYYLTLCIQDGCTPEHVKGIQNRILAFGHFAAKHPERMKQPGITRGLQI